MPASLSYDEFLATKTLTVEPSGMEVSLGALPAAMHTFQRVLTQWALRQGRAALFTGTGTGKTRMQLAWAQQIPGRVLIVAPLAVASQTIREAQALGMEPVQYVRDPADIQQRICITNYDMLHHFVGVDLAGMVLDEASIIKYFGGATRTLLVEHFTGMPYRLCCTATPAPNATEEIGNYAEWLGVMTLTGMRSTFFVHDEQGWRLMPHAQDAFYRWLASWAMTLRGPADVGFEVEGYDLPPLRIHTHFLPWTPHSLVTNADGQLGIPGMEKLQGITDRLTVRQQTIAVRAARVHALARAAHGQVVIWCGLNAESTAIMAQFPCGEAVEITGSHSREEKEARMLAFLAGQYRILVTKIGIAGFGVNMQCATTAIFAGMNDSFEGYYQAVRRLWRYGQHAAVETHVVLTEHERPIWDNVQRKEREATAMIDGLVMASRAYEQAALGLHPSPKEEHMITQHGDDRWTLLQGDCVEGLATVPDASVGLVVYSPPFSNLFQYHASERDMGNTLHAEQFFAQHHYLAQHLRRILMPGRLIAMHVMQVPAMLVRDGWIGLHDFRGQMIAHMQQEGFLYAGEVTCAKSPQAQALRIRAKGLAFHQLHKDSAWSRPALNDYILLFRNGSENHVPVVPNLDNATWIVWAAGIWLSTYFDREDGYRESYTLNAAEGRDPNDTKHICPLPIDLVERCVRLWSNPGETVCDPFAGLGTTGVVAIQHGRQFVGCELKESYVQAACRNLSNAAKTSGQPTLFG